MAAPESVVHEEIARRAKTRRRRARASLYLLNVATGWGLGHIFFTLTMLGVSPRLHALLQQAAAMGPVPAAVRACAILMEPAFIRGGLTASLIGAAGGWLVAWFQVRVLERAGELVHDAELERTIARRTIDLTLHNQRMAELNRRLEEARADLEARNRELRDAQEKLLRTERLAAITETAVSVNHELNGPLMVVLGQSQLLLRSLDRAAPAGLERRIRAIEEQSLAMAAITRKLANLVEPVSRPYLSGEDIRMLDLNASGADPEGPAPVPREAEVAAST